MQNVTFEAGGQIAVLTINEPKRLNALSTQTLSDISEALNMVDASVRVVIVTGAGEKAFVAGADIAEMKDKNSAEGEAFGRMGSNVFRRMQKMPQVFIAAVNGYALGGGCELAMACDIRYASENAVFSQPESTLGIIPGFGGTQRLPRLIGSGRALELILTGSMRLNAQEALQVGLVNKVVAAESLMEECTKLAQKIAKNSAKAVEYAKKAVYDGLETDLDSGLTLESKLFGKCFATQEQKDAMDAFVNKKK
ncbi:MAG: enoyl-CoA hydratase-related protein [Christensenellales bacterium]